MEPLSPLHIRCGMSYRRIIILSILFMFLPWLCVSAKVNGDYSGNFAQAYCKVKDDKCIFSLITKGKQSLRYAHVQLSLDKDFSRIKYIFEFPKKNTDLFEVTVSADQLVQGIYYWRVADATGQMIEPADGTMLEFGSARPEEYVVKVDNESYDDIMLSDDTELSIESIWLRTEKNGNHLEWSNAPFCSGKIWYEPDTEHTNSHGMVVEGDVIYVARGSFNVPNWKYDKEQVWLDRYDLATGATLPMLRVRQDTGEDYPVADLMTLIARDADGTVYFTSSIISPSDNKICLYTIDLNNVVKKDGYDVVLSHLENEFTVPQNPDYMRFCMVYGSIKSKDYYFWGASNSPKNTAFKDLTSSVYRWRVSGNDVKVSTGMITQFVADGENPDYDSPFVSPKVIPIGENKFYFHVHPFYSYPEFYQFHPALYSFPESCDGECELLSPMTASMHDTQPDYPFGVSLLNIGNSQVLGFGRMKDVGSSVQLIELPKETLDFKEARPLWNINPVGFSKLAVQGCNLEYLPDGDDSLDGRMLVYVPNGGMGLYRLTAKGTTVGIDSPTDGGGIVVAGRTVILPYECGDVKVVDISGRVCARLRESSSIDLSGLPAGIYLITSNSLTKAYKVVLN